MAVPARKNRAATGCRRVATAPSAAPPAQAERRKPVGLPATGVYPPEIKGKNKEGSGAAIRRRQCRLSRSTGRSARTAGLAVADNACFSVPVKNLRPAAGRRVRRVLNWLCQRYPRLCPAKRQPCLVPLRHAAANTPVTPPGAGVPEACLSCRSGGVAYHVSVNINGAELSFCGQWCCAIALAGQRQASAVRRKR